MVFALSGEGESDLLCKREKKGMRMFFREKKKSHADSHCKWFWRGPSENRKKTFGSPREGEKTNSAQSVGEKRDLRLLPLGKEVAKSY